MKDVNITLEAILITLTNQARKVKTGKEDDANIEQAITEIKLLFEEWHEHELRLDSLGYF